MRRAILSIMMFFMALFIAVPQAAYADFPEKPVGFVVVDKSGNVDGDTYSMWREVVKWAYHFPEYKITDSPLPQEVTAAALRNSDAVTPEMMAALADKSQVDVLVAVKVYDLNDYIVTSGWDSETYVKVEACADLYVYKKDGNKFLKSKLRERDIKNLGNYEQPQITIKWALSKLVNTMEGRPVIRN